VPGAILHLGATVQCSHGGAARPTVTVARVTVGGQPVATQPPPSAGNGPCATATWTTAATRVTAMGQPVLLLDSQATCVPTGTPLVVASAQTQAVAQ
jgi:hypothetical protein